MRREKYDASVYRTRQLFSILCDKSKYDAMKRPPNAILLTLLTAAALRPGQCCYSSESCLISPRTIVSDACASYATLDQVNTVVKPAIDDLVRTTDFFSHYRLNLFHKVCPFWTDENGMCGNQACAVLTLEDEDDIPEVWRASELSKLEGPQAPHPGKRIQRERPVRPLQGELGEDVGESCVVEYDDECDERDYCVLEDESAASKGDYVSLLQNPERFTGYTGAGARQVWDAIYRENCFQRSSFPKSANLGISLAPVAHGPAALDFRQVLEAAGRQQVLQQHRQHTPLTPFVAKTGLELDGDCVEKRVFYRVISGMHASISSHLCWDFLNQTSGEWHPNLECYRERLHDHPKRISNLYFNYALVTRAVAKLGPSLQDRGNYVFCSGDPGQDRDTRAKIAAVTNKAASARPPFDESLMFQNGEGPSLKEDFRIRFRNVSRMMDCVGCDKCRLWGKLQTAGYGTALKVLFESENDQKSVPRLKRTELVALFNTYARISSSLHSVGLFRQMMDLKPNEEPNEELNGTVQSFAAPGETQDKGPASEPVVTLDDVFHEELTRVIKAFAIVLKSWVEMPSWIWYIASTEMTRLWQFYIGLPVQPRTWKFERPRLDEL